MRPYYLSGAEIIYIIVQVHVCVMLIWQFVDFFNGHLTGTREQWTCDASTGTVIGRSTGVYLGGLPTDFKVARTDTDQRLQVNHKTAGRGCASTGTWSQHGSVPRGTSHRLQGGKDRYRSEIAGKSEYCVEVRGGGAPLPAPWLVAARECT